MPGSAEECGREPGSRIPRQRGGREAASGDCDPDAPSHLAAGLHWPRRSPASLPPGRSCQGSPRGAGMPGGPKAGLPTRACPEPSALQTRTMPPAAARTPACRLRRSLCSEDTYLERAAARPTLRREAGGGPAGRRARGLAWERRRGRRLRGAAVSSTDSSGGGGAAPPVVRRAAAPPLPRAGRAGGAVLQAPRPRHPARPSGGSGTAGGGRSRGAPALPGYPSCTGRAELRKRGFPLPGRTPVRPRWEPLVSGDHRAQTLTGIPGLRAVKRPACPNQRRWAGPVLKEGPRIAPALGTGSAAAPSPADERIREAAARWPPWRLCQRPVSGGHQGWS